MPFVRPVCGARSGLSAGLYCGDRPPAAITAMEKVWRVLHAQVGQPMGTPHAPAENLPSPISNRAYVTYRQLSRLEGPRDGQTEGRTRLESEAACQGSQQQPKAGHGKENRLLTEDCAQSRQEVGQRRPRPALARPPRPRFDERSQPRDRAWLPRKRLRLLERALRSKRRSKAQGQGPSNQLGCPAGQAHGAQGSCSSRRAHRTRSESRAANDLRRGPHAAVATILTRSGSHGVRRAIGTTRTAGEVRRAH